MSTTTRRRLSEVLSEAMEAFCAQEAARHPELADQIAAVSYAEIMEHLEYEAHTKPERRGRGSTRRVNTRKCLWRFYLRNPLGQGPRILLAEVWAHQLCDADGQPIDVQADVRALLQQQGQRIPDDVSTLTDGNAPSAPEGTSADGA